MSAKSAPTDASVDAMLSGRWSPRAFSDKPVDRELIASLLEAARWAPSSYNMQPWRFIVWDRHADEASFDKAFATLVPFNQGWNAPVPVLIGVFANTLTPKGETNRTAAYDAGAAAMSLVLQAHAMGMAAHQMSGFDPDKLREAFGIPQDVQVLTLISIGFKGDPAQLDDVLREREMAPRSRLPASAIAYAGEWGQPV
jgi:nitroreductase